MKTFLIANAAFAVVVGLTVPRLASAASPMIAETPNSIVGHAVDVGVDFTSTLVTPDRVVMDLDIGLKRVHAEVDYAPERIVIHSVTRSTGVRANLSLADIARFQRLVREVPPGLTAGGRHADALGSLLTLVAEAPLNVPFDIDTATPAGSILYTSICGSIGSTIDASYTSKHQVVTIPYLVGPMCYVDPAKGRCGAGGGTSPLIGLVQRFTQQCLNHDVCCTELGDRFITIAGKKVDICGKKGNDCLPQFAAAVPGFFFAPSCGTTAGAWTDSLGHDFTLSGGLDGGIKGRKFSGSVTADTAGCADWRVTGVRTGQAMTFTARSPKGAPTMCEGSYSVTGSYSDCGQAGGTFTDSTGSSAWTWTRTNVVGGNVVRASAAAPTGAAAYLLGASPGQ